DSNMIAPLAALLALLPAWGGAEFSPVVGVLAMPEFNHTPPSRNEATWPRPT
ncbi:unnamed protein product, partial [Prorocentrum cordatum]